ncbi:MAG: D-glycero-alpha-D-manno-heptose-1,7-bisphosphate 7-phosphatase [Ktedonobacterales bacterium]
MFTVFLDRDGVINRNRAGYVKHWDEFSFLPGARQAIARLTRAGYRLIVITNQACVGKGLLPNAALDDLHRRMLREIGLAGGRIETVLYCPHRSDEGCPCRKPAPGLLLRARDEYGVDLRRAVLVGDSLTDMRAAGAAGVPSILVLSGLGWHTALQTSRAQHPSWRPAVNLAHAAAIIQRANANDATREHASWWLKGILRGARTFEARR